MKKRRTAKIKQAKRISGNTTQRETVEQALDLAAFRQEVLDGIDRIAGRQVIRDVFEPWPKELGS